MPTLPLKYTFWGQHRLKYTQWDVCEKEYLQYFLYLVLIFGKEFPLITYLLLKENTEPYLQNHLH